MKNNFKTKVLKRKYSKMYQENSSSYNSGHLPSCLLFYNTYCLFDLFHGAQNHVTTKLKITYTEVSMSRVKNK